MVDEEAVFLEDGGCPEDGLFASVEGGVPDNEIVQIKQDIDLFFP